MRSLTTVPFLVRGAMVALVAVTALAVVLAFGLGRHADEAVEAAGPGPGMALVAPAEVGVGLEFTIGLETNPEPAGGIAGFSAEILVSAAGIKYNGSGDCAAEVEVKVGGGTPAVCLSFVTVPGGGRGLAVLSSGAASPLPLLDGSPGIAGLANLTYVCNTPGVYTVTLTAIPTSANGAAYTDTNAALITVKSDPADTATITCSSLIDNMRSMGKFQILVSPAFRGLMAGYPGYDGTSRLTSPRLFDPNTVVARSVYHLDGDATDIGGASVGPAGTIVSDSDFSLVPAGFEGPAGSREIHTEIRELNLTVLVLGARISVRAGMDAPDQPISIGEVESKDASGSTDFPADSFFNIFVELDLPAAADFSGPPPSTFPAATLFNSEPLLIQNSSVTVLPPKVVYIHGNTSAVPLFFKSDHLPEWQSGDLFGWLVLAGHGAGFDNSTVDIDEFDKIFENEVVPNPLDIPDGDNDGCTDEQELQPKTNANTGGGRDLNDFWDFFDPNLDKSVAFADFLLVLQHFNTNDNNKQATINRNTDPLSPEAETPPGVYSPRYDRGGQIGANGWNQAPPNGSIAFSDFLALLVQFGHSCA